MRRRQRTTPPDPAPLTSPVPPEVRAAARSMLIVLAQRDAARAEAARLTPIGTTKSEAAKLLANARHIQANLQDPHNEAHWGYCDYPGDMPGGVCNCDMLTLITDQNAALIHILEAAIQSYGSTP